MAVQCKVDAPRKLFRIKVNCANVDETHEGDQLRVTVRRGILPMHTELALAEADQREFDLTFTSHSSLYADDYVIATVLRGRDGAVRARALNALFDDYLQSAMDDWQQDEIVPSLAHGAAAAPGWAPGCSSTAG